MRAYDAIQQTIVTGYTAPDQIAKDIECIWKTTLDCIIEERVAAWRIQYGMVPMLMQEGWRKNLPVN